MSILLTDYKALNKELRSAFIIWSHSPDTTVPYSWSDREMYIRPRILALESTIPKSSSEWDKRIMLSTHIMCEGIMSCLN